MTMEAKLKSSRHRSIGAQQDPGPPHYLQLARNLQGPRTNIMRTLDSLNYKCGLGQVLLV